MEKKDIKDFPRKARFESDDCFVGVNGPGQGFLGSVNNLLPRGVVVMCDSRVLIDSNGLLVDNENWALCDGRNGTQDLRGRFIVGYGQNGNGVDVNVWDDGYKDIGSKTTGRKTVTLIPAQMPRHRHLVRGWIGHSSTGSFRTTRQFACGSGGTNGEIDAYNTEYEGSGDAHENRPPYFVLAYIMKIR